MIRVSIDVNLIHSFPKGFPAGLSGVYLEVRNQNAIIRVFTTTFGGEYHIYNDNELVGKVNSCGVLQWLNGSPVTKSTDSETHDYVYHTNIGLLMVRGRREFFISGNKVAEVYRGETFNDWIKRCLRVKRPVFPVVDIRIDYEEGLISLPVAVAMFTMEAALLSE